MESWNVFYQEAFLLPVSEFAEICLFQMSQRSGGKLTHTHTHICTYSMDP